MPRTIDLTPNSQRTVPNDPTNTLQFDVTRFLAEYPFSSPEALINAAITALEDFIDKLIAHPPSLQKLIEALTSMVNGLLSALSPLNALNLFNIVPPTLLGQLDISHIGSAITNLLTDPNFLDASAFSGDDTWLQDLTGGFGGLGSVSTTADGTTKELLGNLIPVSQDQVLPISGKVKWDNLIGTGTPVGIGITGYLNGSATVQATVAMHDTNPTTTDWVSLLGNYTVPANVDSLRTRLIVSPNATAGTVSFSSMSVTKVGPLLQRLISGTDAGTLLPDDITNLFGGILTNAQGLLTKVEQSAHDALLNALGSTNLSVIESNIASYLTPASPLNGSNINSGNIIDEVIPGLTMTMDNLVTSLLNIGGSGFDHSDVANALRHQSFVDTDTSARLAQLENVFTGGVSDGDDFERISSTSLGAGWLTYYQGPAGIWATPNGHDASFATSGASTREFVCIRNTGQVRSTTNLQRVTLVLGSAATSYGSLGVGHNDLWLRISDATTSFANITGIRVRFGGDGSASICRFVNGVNLDASTSFVSVPAGTLTAPGPGSNVWGEAGTPGTARYFRAGIGTSTLLQVTEVGVASGADSTCLRWGHGGRAEGGILGQAAPGSVHQETRKDQTS